MLASNCLKTFECESFIKIYANTPSLLTLALSFTFSFKSNCVSATLEILSPGSAALLFLLISNNFLGLQTRVDNPSSKDPQIFSQSLGEDLQDKQCMQ